MRKLVVLACIFALLASVAALAGCGSGSSAQTPEQVMQAFWAAATNHDANTTWNMMSADSQKLLKSKSEWETQLKTGAPTKFTIGKATINGDNATVKVTYTFNGQTTTQSMPLIKVNGVWKVQATQ
jgi:Domain of unknown function (DUF4878)